MHLSQKKHRPLVASSVQKPLIFETFRLIQLACMPSNPHVPPCHAKVNGVLKQLEILQRWTTRRACS